MECPLRNHGQSLQRPFVTVTKEEWDISNKRMNNRENEKKCDNTTKIKEWVMKWIAHLQKIDFLCNS